MSLKSLLARPFASFIADKVRKSGASAPEKQEETFQYLLRQARLTSFGKEHQFSKITTTREFAEAVPIRDYEELKPYIEKIKQGEKNVLWRGLPLYFAKTSGTTSGVKYIPLSEDGIKHQIKAARNALLMYIAETGNSHFVDGKMIFLSGSPALEKIHGISTGRLSGIVNHHVPAYLTRNRLPSYTTNCIEEWETKLDAIVEETMKQNMTLISGIPPWMQMYFDRLMERSGKRIGELFPDFSVLAHGGVNFEPYRAKLMDSIGRRVDTIETFPASEGFFAYQDSQTHEGLLLNTDAGIYYEFVEAKDIYAASPKRISLHEVSLHTNYALIISSDSGLWAYNIGDTVKFVSLQPYRIVVTGRIKHFISAFGEHVIGEEVEFALMRTAEKFGVRIVEFTVAPYIAAGEGKSYHEWFIEFEEAPQNIEAFASETDRALRSKNIYYDDLIRGHILDSLQVRVMPRNSFIEYMRSIGKLGGQNKLPRLSNDRLIADQLRTRL